MSLRCLSLPVKVLFTCFLLTIGIGYIFGLLNLFLIDIEPHAKQGKGMIQTVILKYYGQRGVTKLESALEGTMGENLDSSQKKQVLDWIRDGAREARFENVQPVFLERCGVCHSEESDMPLPPLTSFEEISVYTQMDMGESIRGLVGVSHVHLFGMSFIFILTGGIFAMSEVNIRWRALLVAIPFIAIWMDIGSWWFTKVEPVFAYTVIIGGFLMGLSLAVQIFLSLYEMWFKRSPMNNKQ